HLMVRPAALSRAQGRRHAEGKPEGGLRWWLANRMGEPPVLYDSYLAERSRLNLAALAQQMGYLDATCSLRIDTVEAQRTRLYFVLDEGNRWTIRSCNWSTEGSGLSTSRLDFDPSGLVGEPFDVRQLESIRSSIAHSFRNKGYPSVQVSHIAFVADTIDRFNGKDVALTVELLPFDYTDQGAPVPHPLTRFGDVNWACQERKNGHVPCIEAEVVEFLLAVDSGMLFNERVLQDTYRRLSNVPGISRVGMPGSIREQGEGDVFYDVEVELELNERIDLTVEAQMIRSDARYGPIGSIGFRNNNLRGKADALELALTGGIISTRPFSYTADALVPNSGTWSISSSYSTLGIPPLSLGRLRPSNQARTELALNWGREVRPEYAREAASFTYGFSYIENPDRESKLRVTPLEFRYSNITPETQFAEWLTEQANPILVGRFVDYTSLASKLGWSSNWERESSRGRWRCDAEWTGMGLHALAAPLGLRQGEGEAYLLGGIPFAHYVRGDGEWTYGRSAGGWGSLHGRLKAGYAMVGTNMDVLPFDRAFFAGGANGVRGWSVRDLGPGFAQQEALDAGYVPGVGDVQLDAGIEFRKDLSDVFEVAWFTDAGNVWIHQTSSASHAEEAEFTLRSLAWGAGLGLRFDFEFFLLRLDGALRLYDPSQRVSERWIGQASPRGMVHLGIGHPF
ncbi:MAG: BamA/TamA family outer membrane protein, partial [Flavobacteriales bacterium]